MLHVGRGRHSRGFTMTEVVVTLLMMALLALIAGSLVQFQGKALRSFHQKVEKEQLAQVLERTISDKNLCSCQLDGKQNTARATDLQLPIKPTSINLHEWRASCDFSTTANILAEVDQMLPGTRTQLKVTGLHLESIAPLALGELNRWSGFIRVDLESTQTEDLPLAPIMIPVAFETAPPVALKRPIVRCLQNRSQVYEKKCNVGWELVGGATEPGSFCIEKNLHAATDGPTASAFCSSISSLDGMAVGTCDASDLFSACQSGLTSINGIGTTWEQVSADSGTGIVMVVGGTGCAHMGLLMGTAPFRCCSR